MKFLLVAAAVFALAVAGPTQRAIVQPGPAGPAPIIDLDQLETISIGPAIIGPAPVVPPVAPSAGAPLVQIILNIKSASDVAGSPVAIETPSPAPTPVQVVEEAEVAEPIIVVEEAAAPEAVIVAQPIIPVPAIVLPETLN